MKKHSHPKTSSINNFLPICFFAVSTNQNSMSWLRENHWILRKSRGENGWFAKFFNFWWDFCFFEHVILEHTLKTRYKTWFKPDLTKSKHQKTTKNYPILNQKTWFLAIFAKPNCISFQKPSNDLKNDSKMMFKNDLSMNSPENPDIKRFYLAHEIRVHQTDVRTVDLSGSSARKVLFGSGIKGRT